MNKTTNYNLNQWEAGDRVLRTDFNSDNAKIDAAIKAVDQKADGKAAQSALNALQTAVSGLGNCWVKFGVYMGDGDSNRVISVSTDFPPKAILVTGNATISFAVKGTTQPFVLHAKEVYQYKLTWSDTGVSWSAMDGDIVDIHFMNYTNSHYSYAVFG